MRLLAIAFAFALFPYAEAAPAAPPAHAHAGHAGSGTEAIPSTARWPTDAPLREGMRRVRTAVEELQRPEAGHMTPEQTSERAIEIEDAVAYMFANCKLAPEPDAALHGILVPLLTAAQRLHRDPADTAAIATIRDATRAYPRRFDDPQWEMHQAGSVRDP